MPKQELIPPGARLPATDDLPTRFATPRSATVPVPNVGGFVPSVAARFRAGYTTKTLNALTNVHDAHARMLDSQTGAIQSYLRRKDQLALLADAEERHAHELALRRMARTSQIRDALHAADLRRRQHERERTLAQAEQVNADTVLNLARVAYVDSEQQLEAQENHGYFTHELTFQRRKLDMLDIELSKKERLALFRESQQPRKQQRELPAADAIDDALIARRDQLNAAGLDTTKIEEAIQKRRGR